MNYSLVCALYVDAYGLMAYAAGTTPPLTAATKASTATICGIDKQSTNP